MVRFVIWAAMYFPLFIALEKLVTKRKKVFQRSVAFTTPPEQPEENSSEAMHRNGRFFSTNKENDQFWQIDLGATYEITKIVITSGGGDTCSVGLQEFDIRIGSNSVANMNGACVLDENIPVADGWSSRERPDSNRAAVGMDAFRVVDFKNEMALREEINDFVHSLTRGLIKDLMP
ncbi:hypothetical protein BSKO_02726 [Bryopsis sp. KO-2023]|nr:hypothetical protein BSKO_02726 [Bryopsis sp. KO-2023]